MLQATTTCCLLVKRVVTPCLPLLLSLQAVRLWEGGAGDVFLAAGPFRILVDADADAEARGGTVAGGVLASASASDYTQANVEEGEGIAQPQPSARHAAFVAPAAVGSPFNLTAMLPLRYPLVKPVSVYAADGRLLARFQLPLTRTKVAAVSCFLLSGGIAAILYHGDTLALASHASFLAGPAPSCCSWCRLTSYARLAP